MTSAKKIIIAILFSLIPVGVLSTSFTLKHNRGPYWLGSNYDPDYAYLMNSLNLVKGKEIGHFDHPGTPLQMLGALFIKIIYQFNPDHQPTIEADVIKDPELYLWTISTVIVIITAGLAAYIGWFVYKLTGSFWLGLLGQSTPFFDTSILANSLTKVSPEALLLPEVMLLMILILRLYKNRDPIEARATPILFGLISGLGLATKLTFLPLALMPLLLLRSVKSTIRYVVSLIGSFFVFTLPIVTNYGEFFGWVKRLMTNAGRHGNAGLQLVRLEAFYNNFRQIIDNLPYLGFLILIVFGVIIITLLAKKRLKHFSYSAFRILLAVMVVEIISIALVVIKDATQSHYLLPSLSLVALLVLALVIFIRTLSLRPLWKHSLFGLVIIIIFLIYGSTYEGISHVYRIEGKDRIELSRIYEIMETQFKDYTRVRYFRSSHPSFALEFGNRFALSEHYKMIDEIYPNDYYYDIATGYYYKYGRTYYDVREFLYDHRKEKIILTGTSFDRQYANSPSFKPKVPITDILNGSIETVYQFAL